MTWLVGFGVGLGVPAVLGVSFAISFDRPLLLLVPVPVALMLLAAWHYRVTGFRVDAAGISILRPSGASRIPGSEAAEARFPARRPDGFTLGVLRIGGFFGTQGIFWNRNWGRFRAYVTDDRNTVELILRSGRRILVSPDDPAGFVAAVAEIQKT